MKIVVFGASGFVGGWICEELETSGSIDLLACVRRWAAAARVARRGIELAQVDLDSGEGLTSALAGADAVINAAVPPSDREPDLALRLYAASVEAGVHRFVQFSSAAVYGDLLGDVDEDAVAPIDAYGRGKAEMERRLLQAAALGGPQLCILRPSIIYGPFSDSWTVRYAKRIAKARWRALGSLGSGTCNLVHARDVARSAILAATSNIGSGSLVVNINGPDVVSWNEYIERFGDALDVHDRTIPGALHLRSMIFGSEALRVGGAFLKTRFNTVFRGLARSGRTGPAVMAGAKSLADLYPTPNEARLLQRKVRYRWDRAVSDLGFKPTVSLEQGLAQSAVWCRVHGIVSSG